MKRFPTVKIEKSTLKNAEFIVRISFKVSKPMEEVYPFCRQISNLPIFMSPLLSAKEESDVLSFWKLRLPGNAKIFTWKIRICSEVKNQLISWHSFDSFVMENSGKIEFIKSKSNDLSTVKIHFSFYIMDKSLAEHFAELTNNKFETMLKRDIRKLIKVIELQDSFYNQPSIWI